MGAARARADPAARPLPRPHVAASNVALLTIGAAMFGTIMFIPLFVQGVLGDSATSSGAILTPLMLGLIGASVVTGQVVSRTGRDKGVLLASPLVLLIGFALLSRLGVGSSLRETTVDMVVVGIGVGLGMQTFTLVVQNGVPRSMLGVATATTQFSRSIGATIGVTVMGALVTSRLHDEIASRLTPAQLDSPGGELSPGSLLGGTTDVPPAVAHALESALAAALHPVFLLGVPLMACAFVATLFVERREPRRTVHDRAESGAELFDEPGELRDQAPRPVPAEARA